MARRGLMSELWDFMRVRKKFWLLPVIVVLLLVGALLVFAQGSALATLHLHRVLVLGLDDRVPHDLPAGHYGRN